MITRKAYMIKGQQFLSDKKGKTRSSKQILQLKAKLRFCFLFFLFKHLYVTNFEQI